MNYEAQLSPLELDAPNDDFDAFFLARYDSLTRSLAAAFGDRELAAEAVQEAFSNAHLRIYTHDDIVGVELGGALKNVMAVAAGVVEGVGRERLG